MNLSSRQFLKNYSFSLTSNLTVLLINAIVIAVVPKLIGVEEYGYFQLFLFYANYIGFFHFGWCDGIYLRYGGQYYKDLPRRRMSAQFWSLSAAELFITVILVAVIYFTNTDANKQIVLFWSAFSIMLVIPKTMLTYVLQLSNRIKEYSIVTVIERIVYCAIVVAVFLAGCRDYKALIYADLAGKVVALIFGVIYCKEIIFCKVEPLRACLQETWRNISAGSKLMIANVAGMLILGIVRLAIENCWSIEVFGKVSLSISVSNMMMVFVNAIGIVLFPMLKRMEQDRMNQLYGKMRDGLMVVFFAALIFYYPIKTLLTGWLPAYEISFRYMALLFPMCIFESKMSMLLNTYMKALRKENSLLFINIITMALSLVLTGLTVYLLKNLELAVVAILVLFAFRSILCEVSLSKSIPIQFVKETVLELLLSAAFVLFTWFTNSWAGCAGYAICYCVYLATKRPFLKSVLQKLRQSKENK